MYNPRLALVLLAAAVYAVPAQARVVMSEVAWMGTDAGGANCEWIELHNLSDEIVDLSSWSVTIENAGASSPKVVNLGEVASVKYGGIAGNGYYLIARDSGECKDLVPATSADWLGSFGSGLSNSGAKLILKNGANEEDTLDSKGGWETSKGGVGGKNTVPKETPQWTGSAWLTAAPTPRGINHTEPLEELPEEDDEPTSPPVVTVGGTAPLVPVTHPVPTLYVDGGPARIVTAGAETPYLAIAYDSTGVVRKNADISWSFGDGGYERGDEVTYAYDVPGEYMAVARARSKGVSAVALVPIIAVRPTVSIATVTDKGIVVHNEGDTFADVSAWKLDTGRKTAKLPPDTVIAPHGSVLFSYDALRVPPADAVELLFPNGRVAHAYAQPLVAGTSSELVQAVVPAGATELTHSSTYGKEMPAPAPKAQSFGVGALASSSDVVTLRREESRGVAHFLTSLVASVVATVVP